MAKLIVCGCSLSADSADLPGTGYGHQTAQRLGWDVEILARPGCSNGAIRIQIDEALRQRPNFVIVAPTFCDRIEIPANTEPYDWITNTNLPDYIRKEAATGYSKQAGIDNINYGKNPYRMICENIVTLAENRDNPYRDKIDKNTQTAIKQYINHMYDAGWKQQQDEWIMRDGIMQLFYAGIPFLVVAGPLWNTGNIRQAIPPVIDDQHLTMDYHETPDYAINKWPFEGGQDPGYHGSPASQAYLAEIYYGKICEILETCRLTDHK